ncbi:MAG TPA: hypothetical protein VH008_04880 [Pseudonocardia sp.]|jgi:hypothetical protein|nr:hypothetical protein [Pseudonocardia sp.]
MRFVLVHGAWHYGELGDPVRAHLEAAGHEVLLTDPELTAREFVEAGRG